MKKLHPDSVPREHSASAFESGSRHRFALIAIGQKSEDGISQSLHIRRLYE
jgi:hypothetical protein